MDISKIGRARALAILFNAALIKLVPADAPKPPDRMTEEDAEAVFVERDGFYVCTLIRHNFPVTHAHHTVWNYWSITIDVDFTPDDINLNKYNLLYGGSYGEQALANAPYLS